MKPPRPPTTTPTAPAGPPPPTKMPRLSAFRARFRERAFVVHTAADQRRSRRDNAAAGAPLKRALGPFAMLSLGVGAIVGSGVFVLTGVVARDVAGPGVIVSYTIAGFAALLSAFAYAEMASAFPSAGGAFAFASGVFGELVAWTVAADLCLEYALSGAAVARGLTSYAAALFGRNPSALRFPTALQPVVIDPVACCAVLLACALLAFGVREAGWFNSIVNGVNVALIFFIVVLGLTLFSPTNLMPFAPFGAKGIVAGAGLVFFSYVGADSVANAAEECLVPSRDLPIGIVGSVAIATVLYILMCLTIVGMVPSAQIDVDAPFSVAFASAGKQWAGGVVAAGALTGIATSIFVALYSQTRLLLMLGRTGLLPRCFGSVSKRTQTPVVATLLTAAGAGLLALLFDIDLLAELVSLGTLVVYTLVLLAVLVRRYQPPRIGVAGVAGAGAAAGGAANSPTVVALTAASESGAGNGSRTTGGGGAALLLLPPQQTADSSADAAAAAAATTTLSPPPFPVSPFLLWRLFLLVATAGASAACFHHGAPLAASLALAGAWLLVSLSFLLLKPVVRSDEDEDEDDDEDEEDGEEEREQEAARRRRRRRFLMPLQPGLPCLGVASTAFLLGSLGWQAYARWVVFMLCTVGFYCCFGVWHTTGGSGNGSGGDNGGGGGGGQQGEAGSAAAHAGIISGGGGAVELGLAGNPLLAVAGARQPSSSGGGGGAPPQPAGGDGAAARRA
jgi:basic amino acid/polyamine antiporter, APA family